VVKFVDGAVLFTGNAVAMHDDCCCGDDCACACPACYGGKAQCCFTARFSSLYGTRCNEYDGTTYILTQTNPCEWTCDAPRPCHPLGLSIVLTIVFEDTQYVIRVSMAGSVWEYRTNEPPHCCMMEYDLNLVTYGSCFSSIVTVQASYCYTVPVNCANYWSDFPTSTFVDLDGLIVGDAYENPNNPCNDLCGTIGDSFVLPRGGTASYFEYKSVFCPNMLWKPFVRVSATISCDAREEHANQLRVIIALYIGYMYGSIQASYEGWSSSVVGQDGKCVQMADVLSGGVSASLIASSKTGTAHCAFVNLPTTAVLY